MRENMIHDGNRMIMKQLLDSLITNSNILTRAVEFYLEPYYKMFCKS